MLHEDGKKAEEEYTVTGKSKKMEERMSKQDT